MRILKRLFRTKQPKKINTETELGIKKQYIFVKSDTSQLEELIKKNSDCFGDLSSNCAFKIKLPQNSNYTREKLEKLE